MSAERPFNADVFEPDGSRFNVRIVKKLQVGDREYLLDARGRSYTARPSGGLGLVASDYTIGSPDGEEAIV